MQMQMQMYGIGKERSIEKTTAVNIRRDYTPRIEMIGVRVSGG